MSEQQFSASLERAAARPEFVVDEPCSSPPRDSKIGGLASSAAASVVEDSSGRDQDSAAGTPGKTETRELSAQVNSSPPAEDDWRRLVTAKVKRYKSHRPQQERYPSLNLQFDAALYTSPSFQVRTEPHAEPPEVVERSAAQVPDSHVESAPLNAPTAEPRILLETTARVLEFPRPASVRTDELADPVIDRPRIVEAPELLPPPPAMGGILMEPMPEPEPERRPGFDMPLKSASLSRKLIAGMLDGIVVGLAVALFCYVFTRVNGATPVVSAKSQAVFLAALGGIFWAAYQYAFLVRCRTTPGLLLTRLRVSRFDGAPALRSLMRWRALASLLSAVSLGLGYAWCFLDEDQLTWHDRITKTHLAPK